MEYLVQSERVREALEEVKGLLVGKTSMACMGDMLTLAAFSHAIPINNSLLGAFTTEREALMACQDKQPDLLYITEQLEQGYGINLALKVKNISPATSVLLFLHRESQDVVREAIEANVDGIIFVHSIGQSADGDFLKSIRAIANGSSYYPKEVRTMAGYVKSIALAGLSDRESEVLEALCQGMSNKEMAEVLFVSPETIKSHVSTVIGKLGVKDRTQAVISAIRAGM